MRDLKATILKALENWEKIIVYLTVFMLVLGVFFAMQGKEMDLGKYYAILDKNEQTEVFSDDDVKKDIKLLSKCENFKTGGEKCYLEFYKDYTIKNGPEKALNHLAYVMEIDPIVLPGCHYISHGIGEGYYIKNDYDLAKSYRFDVSKYFKNVGACGNGFYHGISIGLTRQIKDENALAEVFKDYCLDPERQGGSGEESCMHGIGHAVMSYFDSDTEKSIKFCHRLYDDRGKAFECLTGVEMEDEVQLSSLGLFDFGIDSLVETCGKYLEGSEERQACIVERAGRLGRDKGQTLIYSFLERAKICNQLPNLTEQKACAKLQLIHAIRLGRSQDADQVCQQLDSHAGRIECTVLFAYYFALSVDLKKGEVYKQTVRDACRSLPYLDNLKCLSLARKGINSFDSSKDHGDHLTLSEIKYLVKNKFYGQHKK